MSMVLFSELRPSFFCVIGLQKNYVINILKTYIFAFKKLIFKSSKKSTVEYNID